MKISVMTYTSVPFIMYIIYVTIETTSAELSNYDDIDSQERFLQSSRNPEYVSSISDTLSNLDNYLSYYQKRTCQFGLNSHHCALSSMDHALNAGNWLNSAFSPGKRSQPTSNNDPELKQKYEQMLSDILVKREHLAVLQNLLKYAETQSNTKSKRTCMFNLGGRCATELASAIADQYYYLNSANSPGRRRRRHAPIYPN